MPPGATTTAILIRHGEKDESQPGSADPHLSVEGRARAQTLVHVVGNAGIKAIYTSRFIRTKEMAQPLASKLNLEPVQLDEPARIKKDILTKRAGQSVLVIGHTDTIPQLVALLGGDLTIRIKDGEFDNLYLLSIAGAAAHVTALHYGKAS